MHGLPRLFQSFKLIIRLARVSRALTPLSKDTDSELEFERLLTWNTDLLVLSLGADLHSSNTRLKNWYRKRAAEHNAITCTRGRQPGKCGYVAIVDVACIGSQLGSARFRVPSLIHIIAGTLQRHGATRLLFQLG